MSLKITYGITDGRSGSRMAVVKSGDTVEITIEDRRGNAESIKVSRDEWKEINR